MTDALTQMGSVKDPAVRLRQKWGEKVAQMRGIRDMSRASLAAAVGVSEAAVGMWERGETSPRPHLQVAVAAALDVPHGVLFPMEAA